MSPTQPKGLLDLPPELREHIYELIVVKPRNTITMLSNYNCFTSEVSASQPAISRVNHQLRRETLATFYSNNLFLADLSDGEDLETAKRWLRAIGDPNVACLRRLALCGWTKVPFGHMLCRRWVRVVLDLREGRVEVEGNPADQHPLVTSAIEDLKARFRLLVESRQGRKFDAASLAGFMDGFHGCCITY